MRLIPAIRSRTVLVRLGALSFAITCLTACGPAAEPTGAPLPTAVAAATDAGSAGAPPEAALAAEGGDPVIGRLGSYVWGTTGSDSGWLPGAPITVAANEPLLVAIDPPTDVSSWRARYAPADQASADGAAALGEGGGDPSFLAPAPGRWTVELTATFGGNAGDATYYWLLDVR
jgi:hypothetical protein